MKSIKGKSACFCWRPCKIAIKAIILTIWLLAAIIFIICKCNYYYSYPVQQKVEIMEFTSDYNIPSISVHVTPKSDNGNLSEKAFASVNSWFDEAQKYASIFESCSTNYVNDTEVDCSQVTTVNQTLSRGYNTFTFSFGRRIHRRNGNSLIDRYLMKFKMKSANIGGNWVALSVNRRLVIPQMEPKSGENNFLTIPKNSLKAIVTFTEMDIFLLKYPYSTDCSSDYEDRRHCDALCFERSYRRQKQWPGFISTVKCDKIKDFLVNVSNPDRDTVRRCDMRCQKQSCIEKKYDLSLKYSEVVSGEMLELYVYRKSAPNMKVTHLPLYTLCHLFLYCGAVISFTLGSLFIIFRI